MTIRSLRAAACVAILAALSVGAAAGRPFRFDDLARAGRVGNFALSPDGKWIAFGVGTPDVVRNRTLSAIWLAPSSGGTPRRLTDGSHRDSDPAF